MSKYLDLSINEIHELLLKKEIKPIDLVEESFKRIDDNKLNAFITIDYEGARKRAVELENLEVPVDNLLFEPRYTPEYELTNETCAPALTFNIPSHGVQSISVTDAPPETVRKPSSRIIFEPAPAIEAEPPDATVKSEITAPLCALKIPFALTCIPPALPPN